MGADYSGGEGGALRHWDDARYQLALPQGVQGQFTVRVRALYQATTREYVEFLARENRTDDRGMELLRRYNASGRAAPFVMAETTTTQQVGTSSATPDGGVGPGTPPGGCTCSTTAPPPSRGLSLAMLAGALTLARRRRRRR